MAIYRLLGNATVGYEAPLRVARVPAYYFQTECSRHVTTCFRKLVRKYVVSWLKHSMRKEKGKLLDVIITEVYLHSEVNKVLFQNINTLLFNDILHYVTFFIYRVPHNRDCYMRSILTCHLQTTRKKKISRIRQ